MIDIVTIKIEKSTFDETINAVSSLIGMRQIEGFDCDELFGLLKCLIGISKKQLGIKYKYSNTYGLVKLND